MSGDGWNCVTGQSKIEALVPEWRAAAVRAASPAVAHPAWVLAFANANRQFGTALQVYVERRDGLVVSVLPLTRSLAVTGRTLCSGADATWPYFSAVLSEQSTLHALIPRLLKHAGSLEWSSLRVVDPIYRALVAWSAQNRGRVRRRRALGEAIVMLDKDWPHVSRNIAPHLLRDMRGGEKKLKAAGLMEFAAVSDPEQVTAILPEFLSLEMRGWKGRAGSAILQVPELLAFYLDLVRRAVGSDLICLYTLRVADTLVAGELTVRAAGRIEVLKIAYDESRSAASPGTVLRSAILRDALQDGNYSRYCMGRPSSWKSRWIQRTRPLYTVHVYRNPALRIMDRLLGKSTRAAVRRRLQRAPRDR